MNRNILTVAAVALSLSVFGQTQQVGQENLAPSSTSTSALQNTSHESNRSINTTTLQQITPSVSTASSAHSCAMHDLNEAHYASRGLLNEYHQSAMAGAQGAANLNFPETPNPNEISVIFHVVHNPNNPAENVSNAAIMALFTELQEDYQLLNSDASLVRSGFGFTPADCDINFCLATQDPNGVPLTEIGVVRVATTEDYYDHANGEENKMKFSSTGGSDIWNRNNYLNIWICDITNGLNYGTAGYAYRPTPTLLPSPNIDGIVIDYNLGFGSNVLTHEVGHYLGLDHTWGGSGSCSSDDGFTDTPNTIGPADQQAGFSCGIPNFQTCGSTEVQYENYMDYATGCTYMFTQEQANYMLSILQGIRGSLLLSPGCDPTNTPPNSAFTSFPTGPAPVIIPENASVNFYDQSTNVPTGWTWTISGTQGTDWQWIGGTNQNSQDPVAEFYTVGTYDVTLTASNGFGVDATPAIENMYVEVAPAATGIGCDTLRNWIPGDPAGEIGWSPPSAGAVNGHALIGADNALQWAQPMTSPTTTDIRAIEYAAVNVDGTTGEVIWKIYADNAGVPGTVLSEDTVALQDITEGAWNQINVVPPVTGIAGNFWVGFEIDYTNPGDTFIVYSQIAATPAANTDWWYDGTAWEAISTTTGGAAGTHSLVDVLTSTGAEPQMDFTATGDSVCQGGDILVDGSISTNNQDYRWYIDDTFPNLSSPVLDQSNSSSNTFNFPYAPGTYYMYLFGDGSCLTSAVYLPIEVLAPVTATVTPTATTCGNNNGSITVTGETGGDGTYYYSLDGVNYQVSNTFTGLAPGDYDVYIATLGDNCEAMYTVNVATSTPATATASASQAICPGENATITATGGGTYDWSDGFASIGTNASETVSPSVTTQYSCLVTDGLGCQTTVYTTVNVNTPIPPTISASGSTTICAGTTVDLTSSTPTGNVWSTGETSSTITVGTAGNYTVTSDDVNGCPATSAPFTVTVNAAPSIASGAVTDPNACGTATGSIEVTGPSNGSITWTGTSSGNSGGSVSLPYTISGLAAGSYNITLVDGNGCTSNLLAQPLNDPNPPATPTISNSGALTFCDGGSVTLTSSYTGAGNSWTTGETTDNITVTTSQTISVTYTDMSGCSSTSTSVTVTVNPLPNPPTITPNGSTTICDGETVTLSSSQGTGNVWSTGETTQDIDVTTSGTYDVEYTNMNGCSATSAPITITVNPLPTVSLGALNQVCDYTPSFTLSGGTPAGGTYSGPGVTGGDFDPATAGLGTHTITYEYTDGNGCTNTATQDILVDPCVSVDEVTQNGLQIYPNPTDNEIFVELEGEFSYTIQDARGRLITDGSANDKASISLRNLETGVYFINVTDKASGTISTTRVVKQ
ncbi:MAG: M43 family zinc metalloprotease [bacterium]|nr:M43 family zinc metalloprotease [bacterium]